MDRVRWGIIGAGGIANVMAADFAFVPRAELVAIASRDQARAHAFADRFGVAKAYGSYGELIADDEIDVVYVATPHTHHRDVALAAIEAGKAVLMEKAFTATLEGTRQVIEAARAKGVFVMEALWTRFLPAIAAAREIVAWGRLGDVLGVQGDLCAYREYDPTHRLFDPALGGGALLDLGVYPVGFAQGFLGSASEVRCVGRFAPNGVDLAASLSIAHTSGGLSTLACGFDGHGPSKMSVYGTKGWIEVEPRFHHPTTISVHRQGVLPRIIEARFIGRGYAHEIAEVGECLRLGYTESQVMSLDDTLEIMRVLDQGLEQLGVRYEEADMSAELA